MKHTASGIVTLCREAGLPEPLLVPAVALALVSSGGHDGYDMRAGMPGAGHWQGLWAIDADRYPEVAPLNLHNPHDAAHACNFLTHRYLGFCWSPAYTNGAARHYRDLARAAIGRPDLPTEHRPIAARVIERSGTITDLIRKAG